jgi:CheY-like chemotaxis protein
MRIRGLVVDDNEGNARLIKGTFKIEFEELGWEVDWTLHNDAMQARETVREAEPFDFAVVDLHLGDDIPNGYVVVRELRKKADRTFVLVVTQYLDRFRDFREKAMMKEGAHGAALLSELSAESGTEWSFASVAKKFRRHLRSFDIDINFNHSDPGILSILQNVGADRHGDSTEHGLRAVYTLALKCLDQHFTDDARPTLSYLAPGRSGAYVCRLDVSRPRQPTQSFVLKMSLDKQALKHELKANNEARGVLSQQTLMSLFDRLEFDPQSGYAAIAGRIADGAVPLGGWLTDSATHNEACEVARVIFGDQLRGLFAQQLQHDVPLSRWLRSPDLLRLRLRNRSSAFLEALADPRAGDCGEDAADLVRILTGFVDTGALPVAQPDLLLRDTKYVKGFGDLHSANILVQTGVRPRPVLIDASRYGDHHWSADSSRLLVDLFLRCWRPGMPSFLWDDFTELSQLAARLCPVCGYGGLPHDRTVVGAFVNEVIIRLPSFLQFTALKVLRSEWHWQWHIALAKEFLRQAFHVDVTPPRSTLALQAAANHVKVGARLVDEIEF